MDRPPAGQQMAPLANSATDHPLSGQMTAVTPRITRRKGTGTGSRARWDTRGRLAPAPRDCLADAADALAREGSRLGVLPAAVPVGRMAAAMRRLARAVTRAAVLPA